MPEWRREQRIVGTSILIYSRQIVLMLIEAVANRREIVGRHLRGLRRIVIVGWRIKSHEFQSATRWRTPSRHV